MQYPEAPSVKIRRIAALKTVASILFLGVLFYFVFEFFIPNWTALRLSDIITRIKVRWLILAFAFMVAHHLVVFGLWYRLLRLIGATHPHPIRLFKALALSLLPKYVPGKALAHAIRIRFTIKAGVTPTISISSVVLESLLGLISGAAVSVFGLIALQNPMFSEIQTVFVIALVGLLVLWILNMVFRVRGARWIHSLRVTEIPGQWALLLALYITNWFVIGTGHWCLAKSIRTVQAIDLVPISSAFASSWIAGVISVIAPAGIGVREGVLYLSTVKWFGEADALLFVTLSRLSLLAAELFVTLSWFLFAMIHRAPRSASRIDPL